MRKRFKYGNTRTELDGHSFASKAEAKRYAELKLLEKTGTIRGLVLQPPFPFVVDDLHIGTYIADFSYWEGQRRVIEDVKSSATKTPLYQIKRKLLKALYKLDVTEITR